MHAVSRVYGLSFFFCIEAEEERGYYSNRLHKRQRRKVPKAPLLNVTVSSDSIGVSPVASDKCTYSSLSLSLEQGNVCEPAPQETSQLTTIYEKIRPQPGTSFQRGSP